MSYCVFCSASLLDLILNFDGFLCSQTQFVTYYRFAMSFDIPLLVDNAARNDESNRH